MQTLAAPFIERVIQEDAPECVSSFFPRGSGVVVFFDADERAVLIGEAPQMRAFVADRLGAGSVDEHGKREPSRRADLRPVTRRVRGYPCGIGLETRWMLSRLSEHLDPGLFEEVFKRFSGAFLCFERGSMRWRVVESAGLVQRGSLDDGICIGPIPRREDAAALGEALDDAFELCRYPRELALAPKGTPCAYKEMGRCPAPCDGSESMDTYRERFERAVSLIEDGHGRAVEQCRTRIEQASGAMDFETAGDHKRVLDALEGVAGDRVRGARSLKGMRLLVVAPSTRRGWAGVWVLAQGGLGMVCAVHENAPRDQLGRVIACIEGAAGGIDALSKRVVMDIGLVMREIHAKPGRGRRRVSRVFDLGEPLNAGSLSASISRAGNPVDEDGGGGLC